VGFIAEEAVLTYEAKKVNATFKEESTPLYFVVKAGTQTSDDAYFPVDLIGDEARKKLDSVVPAEPDSMTLLVTLKLKGKLSSGRSAETNEVTFPIEITRGASCPSTQTAQPIPAFPCFPGQDGNGFTCG
jgi:hypothetical protein